LLEHILICSDGSEPALDATQTGVVIARRFHADVCLLSVFDHFLIPYMGSWGAGINGRALVQWSNPFYTDVRQRSAPILEQAQVHYRSLHMFGQPVQMIVEAAVTECADLIVVGSRGLNPWPALLLGSVSEGVLQHAPCPVLIVRGEHPPGKEIGFRRILLAVDGSEGACRAAQMAAALANPFKSELIDLNVFNPLADYPDVSAEDLDTESYAQAVRHSVEGRTAYALKEADIQYTFCQETGDPAEVIIKVAARDGCDLIVMGSRGLGGFKAMLLGSVSNQVAHHASCPVLVVR